MKLDTSFFSAAEYLRYDRQLRLPGFGPEAQQKLKSARVLVVGAGGLGSPLLLYLAAAGVGTLGIVDFDTVDESNLQRQVLFDVRDLGRRKAAAARRRLRALNPHVRICLHSGRLDAKNALRIIAQYDVVADGSDNFPTRYLVNDACVLLDKTLVYGSIYQFEGQVSVFNQIDNNGERGPNYRDLFPAPPPPGLVPDCAEGGVLGVLPGIIGSLQASEAIKVITGTGQTLSGRLFVFDAWSVETRVVKIRRRDDNPVNGKQPSITRLMNDDLFCGPSPAANPLREIDAAELRAWQARGENFQLVDVREPSEYATANLGGELIPLATVVAAAGRFSRDRKVVVYCRSGVRSAKAIRQLEAMFGFDNLYNLKGGLLMMNEE